MNEKQPAKKRAPLPGDLPLAAPPGVRVTRYRQAAQHGHAAVDTPAGPLQDHGVPVDVPLAVPAVAEHQAARPALVVGVASLAGVLLVGIGLLFAPFAWALGSTAVREIDASGGALTGRGPAQTGRVLGIVGTCLLLLGAVGVLGLVGLGVLLEANGA